MLMETTSSETATGPTVVSLGLSPVVTLFVTSAHTSSERRLEKSMTIATVKERLEPITGVPASTMKLQLLAKDDQLVSSLDDETKMLAMQVVNSSPFKVNDYFDTTKVEKLEMTEDDYDKRQDSVRAFKRRHKMGRFSDSASQEVAERENEFEAEAAGIAVGSRCLVAAADGELEKRGTVRFVGKVDFKPGFWVGVEYDEPVGKHNGTVQGKKYFDAKAGSGAFLRPNKLQVGDYPEIDPFAEDDMDEF
ncbi:CAP Gly-rich domain-containing protein [Entophlyctis helioformis]|nr:CAP Gly-rich domain-containing protein [Entophlyctis helioformis]